LRGSRIQSVTALSKLFVLGAVFGTLIGFEISFTTGIIDDPLFQESHGWLPTALIILTSLYIFTTSVGGFLCTIDPRSVPLLYTIAGATLAFATAISLRGLTLGVSEELLPITAIVSNGVILQCFTLILLRHLTPRTTLSLKVSVLPTVIFLVFCVYFRSQYWAAEIDFFRLSSLLRNALLVSTVSLHLLIVTFGAQYRLDPNSWINSLKLRLPERFALNDGGAMLLLLAGIIFDLWVAVIDAPKASQSQITPKAMQMLYMVNFSLAALAVLWYTTVSLCQQLITHRSRLLLAKFIHPSAIQFLLRYLFKPGEQAAVIGTKTAKFTIDYDPECELHKHLPSTILQIWSEEISRTIKQILDPKCLTINKMGNQISGYIDSERCLLSCLETLKMFAVVYLDGAPFIEKRIKMLASVLPVLNPGLAKLVEAEQLSLLFKRNLWAFFIDFDWVDQRAIVYPHSNTYEITSDDRIMFEDLGQEGRERRGKNVILTPNARNRLIQEAQFLEAVITPIEIERSSSHELYFAMKFENLIPRLQQFYNLEQKRLMFQDLGELHQEQTTKALGIFSDRISSARDGKTLARVIHNIGNFQWPGFRAKDMALGLLMKAYRNPIVQQPNSPLIKECASAIGMIGYPSQALHRAQKRKQELRGLKRLLATAGKATHFRYEESWQILSCLEVGELTQVEVADLIEFIERNPRSTKARAETRFVFLTLNLAAKAIKYCPERFNRAVGTLSQRLFETEDELTQNLVLEMLIRFKETYLQFVLDEKLIAVLKVKLRGDRNSTAFRFRQLEDISANLKAHDTAS
jgi:hypothetical protein